MTLTKLTRDCWKLFPFCLAWNITQGNSQWGILEIIIISMKSLAIIMEEYVLNIKTPDTIKWRDAYDFTVQTQLATWRSQNIISPESRHSVTYSCNFLSCSSSQLHTILLAQGTTKSKKSRMKDWFFHSSLLQQKDQAKALLFLFGPVVTNFLRGIYGFFPEMIHGRL